MSVESIFQYGLKITYINQLTNCVIWDGKRNYPTVAKNLVSWKVFHKKNHVHFS